MACGRRWKLRQHWSTSSRRCQGERACEKACGTDSPNDREKHTASGHAVFRTWCCECCMGRGRIHQHRASGRETTIPAIAIDYGYLNERDDLLQEVDGCSHCANKGCRWAWRHRGSHQVGQQADDFGSERMNSDSVEIGGCECQD